MNWQRLKLTSAALYERAAGYVTKTPERKWTAVGVALGFGGALILVPPLGIAMFGTAFAGWWLVVGIVTALGALLGNRVGIEVQRRKGEE